MMNMLDWALSSWLNAGEENVLLFLVSCFLITAIFAAIFSKFFKI